MILLALLWLDKQRQLERSGKGALAPHELVCLQTSWVHHIFLSMFPDIDKAGAL